MDFRLAPSFAQRKKAISALLALIVAAGLASYYWVEQREWLAQVTLEVQASSAPNMGMADPTRGALWLRRANEKEKVIRSKDWTSPTAKPLSRLRFDFPTASYQQVIFFPDPSLQEIEIVAVRLIPHGSGKAINVSLDRVQSEQTFVSSSRTSESVTFKRSSGTALVAMTLGIVDVLEQIPPAPLPALAETIFVFLAAFLASYGCVLLLLGSSKRRLTSADRQSTQAPFMRFGIILGLVACMAAAAPDNSYPDEYLHVETARYYRQHWLPPSLDNEWVVPTLSHYGLTYLAETDMGYFFAGKFALVCQPFSPDSFTAVRLFNVALLIFLSLWSLHVFGQSSAPWVFLLTPQLWYVFSAYNTEGWALFLSFLLIGQMACKDSSLQEYLKAPQTQKAIALIFPALSLACLLALAKRNFLFVLFFFATWLIWQLITRRDLRNLPGLIKIVSLVLIPVLLRFGVQTYQSAVNNFDLPGAIRQQAEKYAQPEFKPSTLEAHPASSESLHLKDRGLTLQDVLIRERWLYRTGASFFGTYGWMLISSPRPYYLLMGLGWVIFMASALVATFTKPPKPERIFCGVAWLFLPWIMITALYYSWTSDFQPQGRYLFPFLPVLFYMVNAVNPGPRRLMVATVWGLFLLSSYGFVFFGLRALAYI